MPKARSSGVAWGFGLGRGIYGGCAMRLSRYRGRVMARAPASSASRSEPALAGVRARSQSGRRVSLSAPPCAVRISVGRRNDALAKAVALLTGHASLGGMPGSGGARGGLRACELIDPDGPVEKSVISHACTRESGWREPVRAACRKSIPAARPCFDGAQHERERALFIRVLLVDSQPLSRTSVRVTLPRKGRLPGFIPRIAAPA